MIAKKNKTKIEKKFINNEIKRRTKNLYVTSFLVAFIIGFLYVFTLSGNVKESAVAALACSVFSLFCATLYLIVATKKCVDGE